MVRVWLARLIGSFATAGSERDLAEEMEIHLQMEEEELVRQGIPPAEARRLAALRSGGVESAKEAYRDQRGFPFLGNVGRDLRYALRMVRRSPGFTALTVTSLALAIGANAAVFSLADAVFLRTLPVPEPEELILLQWTGPEDANEEGRYWSSYDGSVRPTTIPGVEVGTSFSMPLLEEVRRGTTTLSGAFAFARIEQLNVVTGDAAGIAGGLLVTEDYHSTLGVPFVTGRPLAPSDHVPGAEPVAVLSYGYWQGRFGGDRTVVGRVIDINTVPTTVVGVTAPGFVGPLDLGQSADVTLPMAQLASASAGTSLDALSDPRVWWVQIMGRRRPGATVEEVQAELSVVLTRALAGPSAGPAAGDRTPGAMALQASVVSGARGLNGERSDYQLATLLLTTLALLVLLLASTNVAGLLLSRAVARRREITVRLTLGASRRRILVQLLTETLVLVVIAEALGLLLALSAKNLLHTLRPSAAALDFVIGGKGFVVATLVALLTVLICGLMPAIHATRITLAQNLKSASLSTHGGGQVGLRAALLVGQISISVVLLFGSTLFLRTLRNLNATDAGFDQDRVLLFRIDPRLSRYGGESVPRLYRELQEAYAGLPGVVSVSFARHALLTGGRRASGVLVVGEEEGEETGALVNPVGPAFFETLRIPLRAGRSIQVRDDERSRGVAVVNEAFVREKLGGEEALGRTLRMSGVDWEIVGVASDAQYHSLREPPEPTVYLPFLHSERGQASFAIRTAGEPSLLAGPVRRATRQIDPSLSIFDIATQREAVAATLGQERVLATTTSAFGLLALVLAMIGVYGVVSYVTTQRTGEIGLRMALGATGRGILWLVARRTLVLLAAGIVIGGAVATITSRYFSELLYGLAPGDAGSLLLVTGIVATTAVAAICVPANRARRVSPLEALRQE